MHADCGAEVGCHNQEGRTGLLKAADLRQLDIAQLLLNHDADVDAIDSDHYTSLLYASGNGYSEIVELLVERGANVSTLGGFGMAPI